LTSTFFDGPLNNLSFLKTEINVPTVSNKQINLFLVGIKKATGDKSRIRIRVSGSVYPDPYQNVTDSELWFSRCTVLPVKYSSLQWRNTVSNMQQMFRR
jgi:hypothetical protein